MRRRDVLYRDTLYVDLTAVTSCLALLFGFSVADPSVRGWGSIAALGMLLGGIGLTIARARSVLRRDVRVP